MVQGIGDNLPNMLVVTKDLNSFLKPGQTFKAVVAAKDGQHYLLKMGENLLPVRSENLLSVGQQVKLHVLGFRGEELLVKKLPLSEGEEVDKNERQLIRVIEKYGVRGDKEIGVIKENIAKLPIEENTAVRYLLDPHLFTALLIPSEKENDSFDKLEITRYRGTMAKEDIWEVSFELEMATLGHLELKMKMLGENLFMQIWAGLPETENILKCKKNKLELFCTNVEIIPVNEGPLITGKYVENLDLMV